MRKAMARPTTDACDVDQLDHYNPCPWLSPMHHLYLDGRAPLLPQEQPHSDAGRPRPCVRGPGFIIAARASTVPFLLGITNLEERGAYPAVEFPDYQTSGFPKTNRRPVH